MNARDARVCSLFDGLATRVRAADLRTIGFTGAVFGEGASTLALGTSLSLARLDATPVLLVDANWARPSLTMDADAAARRGLAELLHGTGALDDVVIATGRNGLCFVSAGASASHRPPLDALPDLLDRALVRFGTVVVDLPPALAVESEVLAWAGALQQLFLVVRNGTTPLALVRRAIDEVALERPQVVLNRTTSGAWPSAPQVA